MYAYAPLPVFYAEILLIILTITLAFKKNTKPKLQLAFWGISISLPIVFFYYIIFIHTDNIPFQDDYVLLDSLYQMKTSKNILSFFEAFFKQVNQHRFGFERLIFMAIYQLWGSENIKIQIIFGDLFLLGILYLFLNFFKKLNLSWNYFLPIPLLLFNLSYFENANWGIAAVQNTPIIFFAFLTVYLLSLQKKNFTYWAIFTATITMFTSGNGLSIWIIGFLLLLLQNQRGTLIKWTLIAFLLILFYLKFDYDVVQSDRLNLLKHPILNGIFILTFWGNVFFQNIAHVYAQKIYWDIVACIICGSFLACIMIVLSWQVIKEKINQIPQEIKVLLGWMAFLAITGLMLVLSRPTEIKTYLGGETLSRRYMIFGAVFICVGYLGYLFLMSKNKKMQVAGLLLFLPIGIFINLNSYYTSIPSLYRQQQELRLDGLYWKKDTMLLSFGEKYGEKLGYNHPTYMINLIRNIDTSGIYKLSDKESSVVFNFFKNAQKEKSPKFDGSIDTLKSIGKTIALASKERISFIGQTKSPFQKIKYLGLKSSTHIYLFPAVYIPNNLRQCIKTHSFYSSTFYYEFWQAKIPSDNYEVWVIEEDEDTTTLKALFCNKTFFL